MSNRVSSPVTAPVGSWPSPPPIAPPGAGAPLLADPDVANVDFVIARLTIENAFTERKEAKDERRAADAALAAAERDQIADLREEADQRLSAARTEACGKIAEGACGVVGGLCSGGAFGADLHDGASRAKAEGWGSAVSALGKALGGAAGLVASGQRHDADLANATAKGAEMQVTEEKHRYDDADDDIKTAREHARSALDFLREYESTKAKSMEASIKA
jgi:hypothetical protein